MLKICGVIHKKTERELYCEDISKGIHRMVDIQPFMAAVQNIRFGQPQALCYSQTGFSMSVETINSCLWLAS